MNSAGRGFCNLAWRAGLSAALLVATGCQNDPAEIAQVSLAAGPVEDKATDVTLLYSQGSQLKARLFAEEFIRAAHAVPQYSEARKGLRIEFYNAEAKVESVLTAKYARWYEQQNNVLIRNNVIVVTKKGETIQTEELVWNQKAEKFFTEKFVRITTATQTLYGDGMEANQDFSTCEIKNVKGSVAVDKSSMPTGE
jgi:LPS export ABC transporter protein LptC